LPEEAFGNCATAKLTTNKKKKKNSFFIIPKYLVLVNKYNAIKSKLYYYVRNFFLIYINSY